MNFRIKLVLLKRDATRQVEPVEVQGTLLIGETPLVSFAANHSQYGHDECQLFPAFERGNRVWLLREDWWASQGYSGYGTSERTLHFEDGVQLLLKHADWDRLFGTDWTDNADRTRIEMVSETHNERIVPYDDGDDPENGLPDVPPGL